MKRRWKGGLRYAALVALALCVVLLGALFPGYYVRYRDTLYLGQLRQDEGEQSSYNYQGALRNRADTLEKWLSASTEIAVDLQDVDDDGLGYLDELERLAPPARPGVDTLVLYDDTVSPRTLAALTGGITARGGTVRAEREVPADLTYRQLRDLRKGGA